MQGGRRGLGEEGVINKKVFGLTSSGGTDILKELRTAAPKAWSVMTRCGTTYTQGGEARWHRLAGSASWRPRPAWKIVVGDGTHPNLPLHSYVGELRRQPTRRMHAAVLRQPRLAVAMDADLSPSHRPITLVTLRWAGRLPW